MNDEQLIDLLVDGELDEERRRELLAQLDQKPDGWRRCAMAFLQAQCLRAAACSYARSSPSPAPASSREHLPAGQTPLTIASPQRAAGKRLPSRALTLTSMAASFLIAGLGVWLVGWPFNSPSGQPADSVPQVASSTQSPVAASDSVVAGDAAPRPVEDLRLVVDNGRTNSLAPIESLIGSRQRMDELSSAAGPEPLPRNISELLDKVGGNVSLERQYIQVRLPDGRKVVVPVDQLRLRQ